MKSHVIKNLYRCPALVNILKLNYRRQNFFTSNSNIDDSFVFVSTCWLHRYLVLSKAKTNWMTYFPASSGICLSLREYEKHQPGQLLITFICVKILELMFGIFLFILVSYSSTITLCTNVIYYLYELYF